MGTKEGKARLIAYVFSPAVKDALCLIDQLTAKWTVWLGEQGSFYHLKERETAKKSPSIQQVLLVKILPLKHSRTHPHSNSPATHHVVRQQGLITHAKLHMHALSLSMEQWSRLVSQLSRVSQSKEKHMQLFVPNSIFISSPCSHLQSDFLLLHSKRTFHPTSPKTTENRRTAYARSGGRKQTAEISPLRLDVVSNYKVFQFLGRSKKI